MNRKIMTFDQWVSHNDMHRAYEIFHDEYGDSAALRSDYLEHHYQEYVNERKRQIEFDKSLEEEN